MAVGMKPTLRYGLDKVRSVQIFSQSSTRSLLYDARPYCHGVTVPRCHGAMVPPALIGIHSVLGDI